MKSAGLRRPPLLGAPKPLLRTPSPQAAIPLEVHHRSLAPIPDGSPVPAVVDARGRRRGD